MIFFLHCGLKRVALIGLGIFLTVAVHAGELRMWTSVSGATVMARYVGVEGGQVVLKGADGKQFLIRPDLLSPADQALLREKTGTAPPPADASGPLNSETISGLDLLQPEHARMIGLQLGPTPAETVYFIFDRSAGASQHDILYVFDPAQRGPQRVRPLLARTRRQNDASYHEFESFSYNTNYGAIPATHTITLSAGPMRDDLVWINATSEYGRGRDAVTVEIGGALNDQDRVGHGEIPVISLASDFRIRLAIAEGASLINGYISVHRDISLLGPRQLIDSIRVEAVDAEGQPAETVRIIPRDPGRFPQTGTRLFGVQFSRLRSGQTYRLTPRLDLGPVITLQVSTATYTVP